ncbi:MAG: globin domain-containing protein [Prochloraceae cyanobacterium]
MQRHILEKTFALVEAESRNFSRDFYQKLFAKYPKVKKLFANTNMEQQERKLFYSLAMIVESFGKIDSLEYIVKNLGKRHLSYHVVAQHYEYVGDILLETLELYLKSEWTPIVQQVWAEAYGQIVNLMLEGTKQVYATNSSNYNGGHKPIKYIIKQLRVEAIASKALDSGNDRPEVIAQKLLDDDRFKEMEHKVGKQKTYEVVSDVLERVRRKREANFNQKKQSFYRN